MTALAPGLANQLLRNNGDGTFTDITAAAKVAAAPAAGVAIVPTDFDNRRDMDLLVVHRGRPPALFQNVRDGSFRDVAAEVGLPGADAYTSVAAADVNKDGYTDFFFGRADAPGDSGDERRRTAASRPSPVGRRPPAPVAAQFVDVRQRRPARSRRRSRADALRVFRNLGSPVGGAPVERLSR